VAVADGKIAAVRAGINPAEARTVVDVSGLYVTPGLIDAHVHLFATTGMKGAWAGDNSVLPDEFSFRTGVTTMVDAGSSGWRNFEDFRNRVIDRAATRIFAMLNIVGLGMLTDVPEQNIEDMDPKTTAAMAVKHYDDTKSAVADVAAGGDIYGIWVAGSLRPEVTASQIRTFRASPPSGDWRMINGNLELVAACSVNVPGFMNVRTQALAAGGAILALVAAGSRPLAERRMSMLADAAVLERITQLEERIAALPVVVTEAEAPVVAEPEPAVVEPEAVAATAVVAEPPVVEENIAEAVAAATDEHSEEVQPEPADKLDPDQIKQAREDARQIRKDWLRREAKGGWDDKGVTAGNLPPQFAKNAAKKSGKEIPETERKGGGYPIKDAASLKDAIQAVGRAKPEDRAKTIAHIKSAAGKLGLTKLLPSTPGW